MEEVEPHPWSSDVSLLGVEDTIKDLAPADKLSWRKQSVSAWEMKVEQPTICSSTSSVKHFGT